MRYFKYEVIYEVTLATPISLDGAEVMRYMDMLGLNKHDTYVTHFVYVFLTILN